MSTGRPAATGISAFRISSSVTPTASTAATVVARQNIGSIGSITLYKADTPANLPELLATGLQTLIGDLPADPGESEVLTGVLTVLVAYFPQLEESCTALLRDRGYEVVIRHLPSNAEADVIEMQQAMSPAEVMLLVAQLCFIPYRNVNPAYYNNTMSSRARAISALVGMEQAQASVLLNVRSAEIYRLVTQHARAYRNALFEAIKARSHSSSVMESSVMNYLLNVLKNTELSGLVFIFEELVDTRSPVLRSPLVTAELRNYINIMRTIVTSPDPPYFRITCTPQQSAMCERNNFPVLMSVATQLRANRTPNANNFVRSTQQNNAAVNQLVALHNAQLGTSVTLHADEDLFLQT